MGERAYFYVCFILLTQTPHMPLSPPASVSGAISRFGFPSPCAGRAGILKGDTLVRINTQRY